MTTSPVVSVTDELIAELDSLAESAVAGPWRVDFSDNSLYVCEEGVDDQAIAVILPYDWDNKSIRGYVDGMKTDGNLQYIARACPATMKSLLAHIAELKRQLSEFESASAGIAGNPKIVLMLAGENDQLRAENAGLKRDAERYQWLRNGSHIVAPNIGGSVALPSYTTGRADRERLDAWIDDKIMTKAE